jgi:hypothetical protein
MGRERSWAAVWREDRGPLQIARAVGRVTEDEDGGCE